MQDGDKNTNKFDLAKVITRPDGKGATATIQTHPQLRTMQNMRVVTLPQSSAGAQIIQTQIMSNVQTMIKQVDNRLTVSRPVTPTSYHVQRGATVTNIQAAPRGATPLRTPTPPATNMTPQFVRTSASPRAPNSSGATLLPQSNWISNPVLQVPQFVRTNIQPSPRPRVVTQTIPQNSGSSTITANVVTQQTVQGAQQVHGGNVITGSGNQQAFVATLSLPPRQQGASTLVYSQVSNANQSTPYNQPQRLAVATSLGPQRQVRPINRLPTTGLGVRVTTANISIRQNIPVLTTIPSNAQTRTTNSATNIAQIPARILQPGGATQVINASRVMNNVMTLQPIMINNRIQQTVKTIPQALTIAHVGKLGTPASTSSNSAATITVTNLQTNQNQQQSNLGGQQLTASIVSGTVLNQNQIQGQKSSQIAHILSVNQPNVQQQQQHQIIQQSGNQQSCNKNTLVTVSVGSVVPANMIRGIVASNSGRDPPIAKVLPSRQQIDTQSSQGSGTSLFIHTTPPNVSLPSSTVTSALPANTYISHPTKFIFDHHMPSTTSTVSNASLIDSMFSVTKTTVSKAATTGVTSTVTPLITSSQSDTNNAGTVIASSVSYTPGSFTVVPSSNRIHVSTSSLNQANQLQTVPVRFPQLIVDGNQSHSGGTQIIAMSSSNQQQLAASIQQSSAAPVIHTQTIQQTQQQPQQTHIMIPSSSVTKVESPRPLAITSTASILRKRDSTGSPIAKSGATTSTAQLLQQKMDAIERGVSPRSRRASSDGSTTVSVTSMSNMDQQEQEERAALEFPTSSRLSDFFSNALPTTSRSAAANLLGVQHQNSTGSSSNGIEPSPRKRIKRNLMPNENVNTANVTSSAASSSQNQTAINNNKVVNNNHAKNPEVTVKKPPSASLLRSYKQSWKPANNHFQRYSDVKARDERRPNVMDLANQPHVAQKINGWKVYHLSSQIEELCEMESQVYDKLNSQLESIEAHDSSKETDRVSELLKANMQREKVMIDGINDAKTHLMKVFDHKTNVEDIIQRCASKRNFKKREKPS